jgi:hypothetical protein
MIGVINPNDTWTLEEHLKRVEEAEFELTPEEDWPSEQEKPDDYNTTYDKNSTAPAGTSQSDQSDDKAKTDGGDHGHNLSAGAIAGISIGSAAVLILAGGLIYLCGRRGGINNAHRKSGASFQPNTMGSFNVGHMGTPMMVEQKALTPKMHEAWGGGPQTPGHIHGYAAVPNGEGTYRDAGGQGSPQLNGGFGPRSPPMSPQQGYGGYSGTMISSMTSNDNGTYMYVDTFSPLRACKSLS